MDQQALEYTRAHYDRHANQYASTDEALRARAQGPGAPLKKFHNDIKRQLIKRFAGDASCLLDFACGRGGDIWKWIDAGIPRVRGVDLSPGEIEEARKRFEEARQKRPQMQLDYRFEDSPALGAEEWRDDEGGPYDAVTCMFAIHYFFVTERALKQFLSNVALNLKDGGYFFGTVPDGKRVNACIANHKTFKSPMLTIEARWAGQPGCFGSPYICAIGDTVTGGEKGTQGSLEYLVYTNAFVAVAAQYGLTPVLDYGDARLADMFEPADANKPLKHFRPHFPHSDPSLARASSLFAAFVFKKTGGTPAPAAALGAPPPAAAAAAAPPGAVAAGGADRAAAVRAAAAQRLKRQREEEAARQAAAAAAEAPAAAAAAPGAAGQQQPAKRRRPGLLKSSQAPSAGGSEQAAGQELGSEQPAIDQQQQEQEEVQQQEQQQEQPAADEEEEEQQEGSAGAQLVAAEVSEEYEYGGAAEDDDEEEEDEEGFHDL